jgi:hypothetical protein
MRNGCCLFKHSHRIGIRLVSAAAKAIAGVAEVTEDDGIFAFHGLNSFAPLIGKMVFSLVVRRADDHALNENKDITWPAKCKSFETAGFK